MLKKLRFLFLLLTVTGLHAQPHAQNAWLFAYFKDNGADGLHLAYSHNGYTWKAMNQDKAVLAPTAGHDKLMRDPCIIKGSDGKFHMVWTVSWNEKGIGYASSPDLLNWSEQQYIPVMAQEKDALNCWAPEITYDAVHQEYMIYWATTIPGRFKAGANSGDDKYNHRIYYTTTRDFKHFSKTRLLYDHGFNVIDASIVRYRDQYVMFLKDETRTPPQKNIRIAVSKHLKGPYSKPGVPITGAYWAEGPTTLQIDGKWIVYFDKYTSGKMGGVSSPDLQQWTDISEQLSFPQGMRHGTVFPVTMDELKRVVQQFDTSTSSIGLSNKGGGALSPHVYSMSMAHSHNDYERSKPFYEAAALKCGSIEADIHLKAGTLYVAHDEEDIQPQRTFEQLYLRPVLKQMARNHGKVYADGSPLQLLVDIKTDATTTLQALQRMLMPYRNYFDKSKNPYAVTIVLSGNVPPASEWHHYDPIFFFDGRPNIMYDSTAMKRVALISANFRDYAPLNNAKDSVSPANWIKLQEVVNQAHKAGKPFRFWGTGSDAYNYQRLLELGVNYIGTDQPGGLYETLQTWNK
ncbi:family 43 glycosylhydrolase [Chitinophaga defluvii]|uniref:Family 43 glycosylhydrolase n=1 Tax=Chitinophaga defluvii TaxID=3163343 RepID=A0ABV2T748_9BACT